MAKKSREEVEYDVLKANVRELLKTRQGKDFVWFVLSVCGIYDRNLAGDNTTFISEGRRSVGIDILELLDEVDPTTYARLLLDKQKQKEGQNA